VAVTGAAALAGVANLAGKRYAAVRPPKSTKKVIIPLGMAPSADEVVAG